MRKILFIFIALSLCACTKSYEKQNMLKFEKSPYLQQHAHNPVWWKAWGEKALETAKKQNKPIFLSIGYSTCHWCHVMEKESFEDKEVARALNQSFVAIKVDREERPDLDSIYMQAVQAMTGRGGWPMSVFLTPEGKPFFGGTYFPKSTFLQILGKVEKAWKENPAKIKESSEKITDWLKVDRSKASKDKYSDSVFKKFYTQSQKIFDPLLGGIKGRMKFPPSYDLRVLLRIHRRSGNKQALKTVQTTLDAMARGGIYDHLGGGFHRYSTDPKWVVPHFEKMLYDQSALVHAYLEAFQVTGNKEYELVVRETLDYVLADMTSADGGFYSAEDADSEGKEGTFYVWKESELKKLLTPQEFAAVSKDFEITPEGNFEHSNILVLRKGSSRVKRSKELKAVFKKLRSVRNKRPRPLRDEKVLTAWNGLMIAAMAKAGQVLGEERYTQGASRAAAFVLKNNLGSSKQLRRRWIAGEAKIAAYLDDYAFLIDGLIEVYQATFELSWLEQAKKLQALQDQLFENKQKSGYFFTTGEDKTLIRRGRDFNDNVRPSGNSISVLNLLRLGDLFLDQSYQKKALSVLGAIPSWIRERPTTAPQLMMAVDYYLDRSKEIAVIGVKDDPKTKDMIRQLYAKFNPNKVIAFGTTGSLDFPLVEKKKMIAGKPTAYVCEDKVCKLPTNDVEKAVKLSLEKKSYRLN